MLSLTSSSSGRRRTVTSRCSAHARTSAATDWGLANAFNDVPGRRRHPARNCGRRTKSGRSPQPYCIWLSTVVYGNCKLRWHVQRHNQPPARACAVIRIGKNCGRPNRFLPPEHLLPSCVRGSHRAAPVVAPNYTVNHTTPQFAQYSFLAHRNDETGVRNAIVRIFIASVKDMQRRLCRVRISCFRGRCTTDRGDGVGGRFSV
jgi:hypothetical protein